jgi:CDP-archaeol synthase
MQPALILKMLLLLALANGIPLATKDLLKARFSFPLDARARLCDGRPVFGSSKTVRGVVLAVLGTAAVAPLVGVGWRIGLLLGGVAMAGDLFSSFLKRRLKLPPGSRATGLDQIPESLFPLLACRGALRLTALDIAVTVGIFLVGEMLFSRLLFRLRLREHPY